MFEINYLKLYFHYGYDYNRFKTYYNKGMLHVSDVSLFIEGFDQSGFEKFYKKICLNTWFSMEDEVYPTCLKEAPDPPFLLFYKGDLGLLSKPSVSVVGTREPDAYGVFCCEKICMSLSSRGYVIVSGMARGIDRHAHIGALRRSGETLGVMANGLERCYPHEHAKMKDAIGQRGLLLSEFLPWEDPKKHYFPWRNRIVAGLSETLIVMQCDIRSGTMTTVNWALKQGKDVYALPGDITREKSIGPNYLIGLGAVPINDLATSFISVKNSEKS